MHIKESPVLGILQNLTTTKIDEILTNSVMNLSHIHQYACEIIHTEKSACCSILTPTKINPSAIYTLYIYLIWVNYLETNSVNY